MSSYRFPVLILYASLLFGCGRRSPEPALTVAAAANLMGVFGELGSAFKADTGIDVTFSYGSTAQLAQQIENGAPFDLFAAANTEHIDSLVSRRKLVPESRDSSPLRNRNSRPTARRPSRPSGVPACGTRCSRRSCTPPISTR